MAKTRLILVALLLLGPCTLAAYADNTPSISWATGYPKSDTPGVIRGEGTYSVGNYSLVSIVLIATLQNGGQGGQATCTPGMVSWVGSISGLTSGSTYNVHARLAVRDSNNQMYYYDTSTQPVKVQ